MPAAGLGYPVWRDAQEHPQPDWHDQPLRELAHKGSTVVIIIPDIVKGGNQPTSHRKVAIRACIDELYSVGVEKKDILLLFSNGLHPRTTVPEMKTILGDELFGEFYYTGQITSHD